jgi:anti-sigma B factor antagonist
MSVQHLHGGLEVEQVGRVTVVKVLHRRVLTDAAVATLGEQLRSLVEDAGHRHLVLNFGRVERLTSALLGQLVALSRTLRRAGGRLAVCEIRPEFNPGFRILGLDKDLPLYGSEGDALQDLV